MDEPNSAPTPEVVTRVLETLDFKLPDWYINELSKTHDLVFDFEDGKYLELWPIVEVLELNRAYNADEFYLNFILIGTDGGGEACAIEKQSGSVYFIPYIGCLPDDAIYVGKSLKDLIEYLQVPW
ncbi:hypothetical protein GCM10011375_16410 [Hymenobacter qilianensis]|uniref:Uncharacterized protein n=2 Tax=Hymenobacter qilianensis TaxID=1385715 RepID=A0ACB5PQI6_9BACT|nr:SMI1/KNR4 family protein [Hymenobacter qilianensis]QNP51846.1 SMI1/KNR4 family protein [Hymenobacter qilianensis]GGF62152.1 hypothetical protein GCM10011375_16410 [Hymenobacter qilianensis]